MEAGNPDAAAGINSQKNMTEVNDFHDHGRARFKIWTVNMETENEELRAQVKVLQDNKAMLTQQNGLLGEKLAHFESWSMKMETHLRMQIKYLQENEDMLIKQNENLNNDVAQLERWGVMIEKQNQNLQTRVKVLEENENLASEMTENIVADLAHSESQRDKDQTEMYRLRTKLQTLRCQMEDQGKLLWRLDHAESQMEKAWAENTRLNNKLSELVGEDAFLNKQNEMVMEELGDHTSVKDEHLEQIAQLKAAVKDHHIQFEESQSLLSDKNELLEKQKRELVYQHEVIDDLNSLVSSLKQTILDLQGQLELKQMDVILTASSSCGSLEYEEDSVSEDTLELKSEVTDESSQRHNGDASIEHPSALCESPSLKMQTDNEELGTQVDGPKKNELFHLESWSAKSEVTNESSQRQNGDASIEHPSALCESPSLKMQTDNEELGTQVDGPQKNEGLFYLESLSAKSEVTDESSQRQSGDASIEHPSALCESPSLTMQTDSEELGTQVDGPQKNEELFHHESWSAKSEITDESSQRQNGDASIEHPSALCESPSLKMQTDNEELGTQVDGPQKNEELFHHESWSAKSEITDESSQRQNGDASIEHPSALCESPSLKMQTDNEELGTQVDGSQKNELFHLESWSAKSEVTDESSQRQNGDASIEHPSALCESPSLKMQTDNEELGTQVDGSQKNELFHLESWSAKSEVTDESSQRQNGDASIEHSSSALCESPSLKMQTDNEELGTQVDGPQKNEELFHLESWSAKSEVTDESSQRQNGDASIEHSSSALCESSSLKMQTGNEELETHVDGPQKNEELFHLESWSANVNTNNANLTGLVEDLCENKDRLTNQLFSDKVAHLESLRATVNTNNGDLKAQIEDPSENEFIFHEKTEETIIAELSHSESQQDKDNIDIYEKHLQENNVGLPKQNRQINEKLAHLESWGANAETNIRDFKMQVEDPKENTLKDKRKSTTEDLAYLETQWANDNTEVYSPRTGAQVFWCHLQDQGDLKTMVDHVEPLMEPEWTESEKWSNKLSELCENQSILKKNDIVCEEQEDHNNVGDQPKTVLIDHKFRVGQSGRLLLYTQDNTLIKQTKEIDNQHRDKDGHRALFSTLGQTILNFKQRMIRIEEILTGNNLETLPKEQHVDRGLNSPDHIG
nr:paramyosin-like [Nerophis lumbriciformis]